MVLNFYKSESSVKPLELDEVSSKKVVYIRKNISETIKNSEDDSSFKMYTYEEAKLTKEEYEQYLKELTASETLKEVEKIKEENNTLSEQIELLDSTLSTMLEDILPSIADGTIDTKAE